MTSTEEYERAKSYCSDLLRKSDSPSYTILYCLPPQLHDFHIALRALNIELARIPDTVSHPTVGTMRMQFWRQAVTSTLDGSPPRGQPVTILLARALDDLSTRRTGLQGPPSSMKAWFNRLIAARESRLTNPPFPSVSHLESYAESTYSTLLYLTLSAIPVQSLTLDHLASHIGKAAGIIAVLRGFPLIAFPSPSPSHHNNPASSTHHQSQGSITLPLDILSQHSIRDQDIFTHGPSAPGLRDATFALATRASDHLITARTLLKQIRADQSPDHAYEYASDPDHQYSHHHSTTPSSSTTPKQDLDTHPSAFGVLQSGAIPPQIFLERLEAADFDIFDRRLARAMADWRVPWRAWRAVRAGTF